MELAFTKMHGIGNDFVMLDDRDGGIMADTPYPELAQRLCSRRFGIGADGIILILESATRDIGFRIFNSDGSEPEMCGNGMRCFARLVYEKGILTKKRFTVETLAGTIVPELTVNDADKVTSICVDMGEPILEPGKIPFKSDNSPAVNETVEVNGKQVHLTAVSMGNPHAVIFVDDVDAVDLENQGREIETHERFPEKVNVEFIQPMNDHELKMRVWERGAGETLACGTGACASLVASCLNGHSGENALIHLAGGDLTIRWDRKSNHIFKTGPATLSFTGTVEI
ncbi:MAG: diaminopimelate epimerase [Desulfobacteraceae bacterium]|nr:diaminopimelate epimerase [Desulfobacteraceae bacterium]